MVKIYMGDVKDVSLWEHIPSGIVQTVVTSPPYWSMRTYGVKGQIGHEATVDLYVGTLVKVFREMRRILRDDGTFWLNVGDSFSTTDGAFGRSDPMSQKSNAMKLGWYYHTGKIKATSGLPPKNLVMVPYRLASALQQDGWILRQDVIWAKTRTLPESVQDRPSSIHEHIFLFAKSPKYFYDKKATGELGRYGDLFSTSTKFKNSVWSVSSGSAGMNFCKKCLRTYHADEYKRLAYLERKVRDRKWRDTEHRAHSDHVLSKDKPTGGKESPKVCATCGGHEWEVHAAPYPERLVAPCILSSTSEYACGSCGKCLVKKGQTWEKQCECKTKETKPCLVFDPFNGSGTTGVVAMRLRRDYLGMDLKPKYVAASYDRMERVAKVRGLAV